MRVCLASLLLQWGPLLSLGAVVPYQASSISQLPISQFGAGLEEKNQQCELPEPHVPSSKDGQAPSSTFWSEGSMKRQIERLSAAVRCQTVTYDDLGDFDTDKRWAGFDDLHATLEKLFPLTHKAAPPVKVNRYGLVFTLQGSVRNLKPLMFTAHQDVVPIQEASDWTYPPFEPYYDGQFLWGRGSCDCKNNLIGTLSAVEELLAHGWNPRRTIILAYGFDEEGGGERGAGHIAQYIESIWGKYGVAMIFDEGGMGLDTRGDAIYALPAVHEKSMIWIELQLRIAGGHSSKPPPHTGIGIMSEIVVASEANPYKPGLVKDSPYYNHLVCQARYSPKADPWLGPALAEDRLQDIADELAKGTPEIQFRIQTSQAVDVINGGKKTNALPEAVTVRVDYRIAQHDSVQGIKDNVVKYAMPIIERYGLVLDAFGVINDTAALHRRDSRLPKDDFAYKGTLHVSEAESSVPTPIAPTKDNGVWDEFSATVRHVYSQYAKTVVPVGDIMNGNTDTRRYWNLTENIYRWSPSRLGTRVNVHTVDERLDMTAHIDGYRLYYDLIRNFDALEETDGQ